MFLLFRKAFCHIKRRKSLFQDLFSRSMTWEYRGVTKGYKGLHGVTGGCKGLQGVTMGNKGWQGVTSRYSGLQRIIENFDLLGSSQIIFLGLLCIKIKVEKMSNFWPKRWTNPFGNILILYFSYTVVFIVFKGFYLF